MSQDFPGWFIRELDIYIPSIGCEDIGHGQEIVTNKEGVYNINTVFLANGNKRISLEFFNNKMNHVTLETVDKDGYKLVNESSKVTNLNDFLSDNGFPLLNSDDLDNLKEVLLKNSELVKLTVLENDEDFNCSNAENISNMKKGEFGLVHYVISKEELMNGSFFQKDPYSTCHPPKSHVIQSVIEDIKSLYI
jgi:hypothetical protein